jgi:hypothetical protein
MDFDRSVFKPAFIAAGMWIPIRVTSQDSPPVVTDTHAGYAQPGVVKVSGSMSSEHQIKYQRDDLPELTEGDGVEFLDADGNPITGKSFRVREEPFVTDDPNDDATGYFMRVRLTKL